jgi:hypothetical protein
MASDSLAAALRVERRIAELHSRHTPGVAVKFAFTIYAAAICPINSQEIYRARKDAGRQLHRVRAGGRSMGCVTAAPGADQVTFTKNPSDVSACTAVGNISAEAMGNIKRKCH